MRREDKPVVRAVPSDSLENKCDKCHFKGKCIDWKPGQNARVLSPLRCYEGGGMNGIYFKRVQR